jgi:GNAT superfamily N-acetyltransferase
MAVLEFELIPSIEKEQFKARFQEYLEEIDTLTGMPVDPDFEHRYPAYPTFFKGSDKRRPFRIIYTKSNKCSEVNGGEIGFFFLNLITPKGFPQGVPSIFSDDNVALASLTDFYLYPECRKKGMAWNFYLNIIDLCVDTHWHVCWECDAKNIPAIKFYEKIFNRIQQDFPYKVSKEKYQNVDRDNREYYFYQVEFVFENQPYT